MAGVIPSPNHSSRNGRRVRLVAIHTAEGALTATALGNYFAKASAGASSHVGIDDNATEQYVAYDRAAWTLRSGNPVSDNAELCGFAKWDRAEWLRHMGMLRRAAAWIGERCRARGIPIRKLTPAQVAAGESGVIGHIDWTNGMKDGSHWDPGPGFPWDLVMSMAGSNQEEDDDMPSAQEVADTFLATPVKMPNGDMVPVSELLKWTNVAAWEGRDRAAYMALGKPNGWFDGGGGEKGSTESGGAQIRAAHERIERVEKKLDDLLTLLKTKGV